MVNKIAFLFFLFNLSVFCQQAWWKSYTMSNSGLPSNRINTINEDTNGNIWIGTDAGIVKYDGVNWTVFNKLNSGLPVDSITVIVINGNEILIGTRSSGYCVFNGSTWQVFNKSNSGLPDNDVVSIAVDNNNSIWLGTDGEGLAKYDGAAWSVYNKYNSGLHCNSVLNINFDASGVKWIGTYSGALSKYDGTTWKLYNKSNSLLNDKWIASLAIDLQDTKWIGTRSKGLYSFSGTTWTSFDSSNSPLPENQINAITVSNNGNKWIGTNSKGLVKFDGTNWTVYNTANSGIISNTIKSVFTDTKGNIWIGTYSNGISILNENEPVSMPVELISFTSSISENIVTLFWTTATESENAGWDIEKKVIPENVASMSKWMRIGFMRGGGTINALRNYSYKDRCFSGKYLYRLKQIDSNGSFKYSPEIQVEIKATFKSFVLEQNYPNPFNPSTKIKFNLNKPELVSLIIFDMNGKLVRNLISNKQQNSGYNEVLWDATDDKGSPVASGIYYYRIITDNNLDTKKMILIR